MRWQAVISWKTVSRGFPDFPFVMSLTQGEKLSPVSLSFLVRLHKSLIVTKKWYLSRGLSPHGNKRSQHSLGFWISDSRYLIPLSSKFQSLVGYRIPGAVFRIPKYRIPNSASKIISRYFGIRIFLFEGSFFCKEMLASPGGLFFDSSPQCSRNLTRTNGPIFQLVLHLISIDLCSQNAQFTRTDWRKVILRHQFLLNSALQNVSVYIFAWNFTYLELYSSLVFTKSVNSNYRAFWLAPVTRDIPWLFTVLRPEPRWRLVSRHFRKTKFVR